MERYSARISELSTRLRELLYRDALTIHAIRKNKPPQFNVKGVYAISNPDREIVYVGKTRKNTVIGRLNNHLTKNQKSDLKVMLKSRPKYHRNADDYLVRCIEIADPLERTYFEHFSISILRPVFNRQ